MTKSRYQQHIFPFYSHTESPASFFFFFLISFPDQGALLLPLSDTVPPTSTENRSSLP
jgi:hypothetical protein